MQDWAVPQRASSGSCSARLSNSVSCRLQWQPNRSRSSSKAAVSRHAGPCCLETPYNSWHSSGCSVGTNSSSSVAPVHVHEQRQHYQLRFSRCKVACHVIAANKSGSSSSCSHHSRPPHVFSSQPHAHTALYSNSCSSSSSSSSSSLPRPAGVSCKQRSVRAGAASLALVDPTTAATAAVASAAAVTATSFSLSKVLAVVLGYAVMAGSLFRSVPQIVKVLQHSSTEGLSLTSVIVELCCYSITIAYNLNQGHAFNTFGEVCACWAQDIVLIALIFRFSNTRKWVAALTGTAVVLGCTWLLSPCCPRSMLAAMQASNIITMALGSRLPQIILNMKRGNAGVLSVTTCLLNVAGNAARVFTTIILTGDMLILGGFLSQGTLNTILLCQSIGTARQRQSAAAAAAGQSEVPAITNPAITNPAISNSNKSHGHQAGPDSGPAGAPGLIMQPAT